MRSTTWMAVLPTSPVDLGVLMVLLVLIGLIVAISDEIAYCEMPFYGANMDIAPQLELFKGVLRLSEGVGALFNQVWTSVD